MKQGGYDFSSTWLGDRPSFLYGRPETGPLTQDDRVAPEEARQALADELAETVRCVDIIGALAAAHRSGLAGQRPDFATPASRLPGIVYPLFVALRADTGAVMETRFLRRMSIFGGVQAGILDHLFELARRVTVVEGEFFFQEGSRGTSAFVLEDGRVSILKNSDGRNQLLRHLETGDCFGEVALLDFGPRSASVLADVDCRAIELSAGNLLEISKIDLEQFALIYMNIARELSRRLRAADDRLFAASLEGSAFATDYAFSTT